MSIYITLPDSNQTAHSNYCTQKSVGILGAATDEFPAGTAFASFSDKVSDVAHRKIFYKRPGENNFTHLTTWNPGAPASSLSKWPTFSFVIYDTFIYAAAAVDEASPNYSRVWVGKYSLTTLSWATDIMLADSLETDLVRFQDADIDISPSGDWLYVVFTGTNTTSKRVYTRRCKVDPFGGSVTPPVGDTGYALNNASELAKASVFWRTSNTIAIHFEGAIGVNSYSSSLASGLFTNVLDNLTHYEANMVDAQMCLGDGASAGLLRPSGSQLQFKKWNGSAFEAVETIGIITTPNFTYGLGYHDNKFHALYWVSTGEQIKYYTRLFDEAIWSEQEEIGEPGVGLDYLSVQNVRTPATVNPAYFGMVAMESGDGSSPYSLFYRDPGAPLFDPVPDYYTGIQLGGFNIEISLGNNGISLRGGEIDGDPVNRQLKIQDYIYLSDDKVLFAADNAFFVFDDEVHTYGELNAPMAWKSGLFPMGNRTLQRVAWLKLVYDSDVAFTLYVMNEAETQARSIAFAANSADSGKTKFVNIRGRAFYWGIDNLSSGNIKIRSLEFEVENGAI